MAINIAKLRRLCGSRSYLAPRASTRCPRCGRIRTGSTVPTNPAHGSQALLKGCEPAIPRAAIPGIVVSTPCTVLRPGGFFDADDSGKKIPRMNSESLMANSYSLPLKDPQAPYFISSTLRDEARRIAANIAKQPELLRRAAGRF